MAFPSTSAMPDIMNLKYLIMSAADYRSPEGGAVRQVRAGLHFVQRIGGAGEQDRPAQGMARPFGGGGRRPAAAAWHHEFGPRLQPCPGCPGGVAAAALPLLRQDRWPRRKRPGGQSTRPNRITVKAAATTNALLVLGENYYRWWYAYVDGKKAEIVPVDHVLRGVYLTPGEHRVEFVFDPLPFKVGKWLTLASFAFFALSMVAEGKESWLTELTLMS